MRRGEQIKSWWSFCLPLPAALGHSRKQISPWGGYATCWLSHSSKDHSWEYDTPELSILHCCSSTELSVRPVRKISTTHQQHHPEESFTYPYYTFYRPLPHSLGDVQFQTLVLIKKGGREVLEVLTAVTLTNLCLWLLPSPLLCIIY